MPTTCPSCSAPLPEMAAFCARCGRPTGSRVAVKETPESLLRQMASMVQKHSRRKLGVKFVTPWRLRCESPKAKTIAVRFNCQTWIFETGPALAITPLAGKTLFQRGSWDDIRIEAFQEAGFEDAKAFAEAYRSLTGRHVEIVKKFE